MSTILFRSSSVFLTVLLALILPSQNSFCAEEVDDVLQFYCKRAAAVSKARDPIERGANFSVRTRTFYKKVGRGAEVTALDSSLDTYYYSFGRLDSVINTFQPSHSIPDLELFSPRIFDIDYRFNFFPNDTGGVEIAIGFDTDSTVPGRPTGLAIIDRNRYLLRMLYLHYPNLEEYKRFSRSFRFSQVDNYLFPDSVWVVASRHGIFSSEHFRIETGIIEIKVYH